MRRGRRGRGRSEEGVKKREREEEAEMGEQAGMLGLSSVLRKHGNL